MTTEIEEIRGRWEARFDGHMRRDESIPQIEKDFLCLFQFIDSQQKALFETRRQYTEAELRAEFEVSIDSPNDCRRDEFGQYENNKIQWLWFGWNNAADFLSAVKDEP